MLKLSRHGGHLEFLISKRFTSLVQDHPMIIPAKSQFNWQVWLNSVQWFQRRFKCEKLTDRQMLSHDKKMEKYALTSS